MNETILHIDMNNFFASVECIYHPEYREVPMAVAGDHEIRHGIILAKNDIAKSYGVVTAEPIWQARKKCPDLVLAKPHMDKYISYSHKAMEIYCRYTDKVESFGIDECWLDVNGSELLFGDAMEIAGKIKGQITSELGLTVSIGVSFNKIFAKLGSDYKKPDAITLVSHENYKDIIWNLPVGDMLFVGKSTQKKLHSYGFKTIGDIANSNVEILKNILGAAGVALFHHSRGEDNSPVQNADEHNEIKTIGNSTTLPCDISSDSEIKKALLSLSETVSSRVRKNNLRYSQVQIWIRDSDFNDIHRQATLQWPADDAITLYREAYALYRKTGIKKSIRSLGVRAGKFYSDTDQISFFTDENMKVRHASLDKAIDRMREKFGDESIVRAPLIPPNI